MTYGFLQKGYYAITIAPDDKHQYVGKGPNERLDRFRSYIYEQCVFLPNMGVNYSLNIEVSEPVTLSKSPRLHVHGIIKLNSHKAVLHFLLAGYDKLIADSHGHPSQVVIKPITDVALWKKYCFKHQDLPFGLPITDQPEIDLWETCIISPINDVCIADQMSPPQVGEPRATAEPVSAGLAEDQPERSEDCRRPVRRPRNKYIVK